MADNFTEAEIVRWLQRIEEGVEGMRDEFRETMAEMVRRDAWEQKNLALDREIRDLKHGHATDVASLKTEIKEGLAAAKADREKAPTWPLVVGGIGVIISNLISILALTR